MNVTENQNNDISIKDLKDIVQHHELVVLFCFDAENAVIDLQQCSLADCEVSVSVENYLNKNCVSIHADETDLMHIYDKLLKKFHLKDVLIMNFVHKLDFCLLKINECVAVRKQTKLVSVTENLFEELYDAEHCFNLMTFVKVKVQQNKHACLLHCQKEIKNDLNLHSIELTAFLTEKMQMHRFKVTILLQNDHDNLHFFCLAEIINVEILHDSTDEVLMHIKVTC